MHVFDLFPCTKRLFLPHVCISSKSAHSECERYCNLSTYSVFRALINGLIHLIGSFWTKKKKKTKRRWGTQWMISTIPRGERREEGRGEREEGGGGERREGRKERKCAREIWVKGVGEDIREVRDWHCHADFTGLTFVEHMPWRNFVDPHHLQTRRDTKLVKQLELADNATNRKAKCNHLHLGRRITSKHSPRKPRHSLNCFSFVGDSSDGESTLHGRKTGKGKKRKLGDKEI